MSNVGHFTVLDTDECRNLLRSQMVGRVGWHAGDAGPLVLPVNYVVEGDRILFRTTPAGVLAQLAEGRDVAFEVDEFDEEAQNGWSVLAQGRAEFYGEELRNPVPTPWAHGCRNLVVSVTLTTLSGRAVSADE